MAELTLESKYIKVTFPGNTAGFSGIWVKDYVGGSAIWTEYNRLDQSLQLKLLSGNYHGLYANGQEFWSGDVSWITYKATMSSRELYGNQDPYGNTQVEVIKVVSGNIIPMGSDRQISEQDFTFFLTPDGKGLIKRSRFRVDRIGSQADLIQSLLHMDYVSFNPVSYNTGGKYYSFTERMIGFNYDTAPEFEADWTADSGLSVSIARQSLYPNLIPGLTSSEWKAEAGTKNAPDDRTLNLSSGDNIYLNYHNAYPQNRIITAIFSVSAISGSLEVTFGTNRNALDAAGETLVLTNSGSYSIQVTTGYGDNYLFCRFKQLSGFATVTDPAAKYLKGGVSYSVPDGSLLANTNLRNCIRVQSSNPNGKQLIYNFSSNVKIADGHGIKLMALSLDNTSIEDGAFKVVFQKPDNSWVESESINMFVDYNDLYPQGSWGRFNLWQDSFFGVSVPSGVDEIKAIGIKWTTTQAIDWLLDGFGVLLWQENDRGIGAKPTQHFGLPAGTLRMRESFALRGVQGAKHIPSATDVSGERVSVVVVGGIYPYGEYVPLTFQSSPSVPQVYQIEETALETAWGDWVDDGYQLTYDASGLSNYLYPISVRNLTQGEDYLIISAIGSQITVDTSQKNYTTGDTLRITYAYRDNVDVSHWNLKKNTKDQWCIKWAYDSWTISHNKEPVYVDYTVSLRGDDSLSCVVGASTATVNRQVQDYPKLTESSPTLTTYSTMVFQDPSNELTETYTVYYPLLNTQGASLYAKAREVQTTLDQLVLFSRSEPLSPLPRNYNLIPHLAFGGEYIAANPVDYLQETAEKFYTANASNAVVAIGSIAYLRDRDLEAWWFWGYPLRDNGVDLAAASRAILRRGWSEEAVRRDLNQHRYLFELSVFAYEINKRHKDQTAVDYKGETSYRRVWYYQTEDGFYTARTKAWDDFQAGYYDPIVEAGKTYYFQYHYILTIPAMWSVCTPATDWGFSTPTIYDHLKRRIQYLCQRYDCDGIILSELLYYHYSFADNDFTLYNQWRTTIKGWAAATDWPRDTATGYINIDDPELWEWKTYYIKKMLTDMAAVAHTEGKLLGVNVNVQKVLPIRFPQAPVWGPYPKQTGPYGTCVDTWDYSLDRYGTPYSELLKENVCDLLFVWLYHKYSAFGSAVIYDFMKQFKDYKERMLVTIGLFPKEAPPSAEEIVPYVQMLLKNGFNVCYAGYPPMLIQDERWSGVWEQLRDYVPLMYYDNGQIEVNPKKAADIPMLVRF